MNRDEEIRLLHERLDYYTREADDDKFDSEEVIKLLKRLNKLEPQTDTKLEAEEALRDFWEYVEGREWEEQINRGMIIRMEIYDLQMVCGKISN